MGAAAASSAGASAGGMVASAVGGFIGPVSSVLMRPVAGSMYWSSCALSKGILSSWACAERHS